MAIQKHKRSPLTPKIRDEVIERANSKCQCTDSSHKSHGGHLGCPNQLEYRVKFYLAGHIASDSDHWIAVCSQCASQIRSLGGKIYL